MRRVWCGVEGGQHARGKDINQRGCGLLGTRQDAQGAATSLSWQCSKVCRYAPAKKNYDTYAGLIFGARASSKADQLLVWCWPRPCVQQHNVDVESSNTFRCSHSLKSATRALDIFAPSFRLQLAFLVR